MSPEQAAGEELDGAPTCSRSASCSTSAPRASIRFRARRRRSSLAAILNRRAGRAGHAQSRAAAAAAGGHQQLPREGSGAALSVGGRPARGPQAACGATSNRAASTVAVDDQRVRAGSSTEPRARSPSWHDAQRRCTPRRRARAGGIAAAPGRSRGERRWLVACRCRRRDRRRPCAVRWPVAERSDARDAPRTAAPCQPRRAGPARAGATPASNAQNYRRPSPTPKRSSQAVPDHAEALAHSRRSDARLGALQAAIAGARGSSRPATSRRGARARSGAPDRSRRAGRRRAGGTAGGAGRGSAKRPGWHRAIATGPTAASAKEPPPLNGRDPARRATRRREPRRRPPPPTAPGRARHRRRRLRRPPGTERLSPPRPRSSLNPLSACGAAPSTHPRRPQRSRRPKAATTPAIRRVVATYGRAIETKDLGLFRSVKPNLSRTRSGALQEGFRAVDARSAST